jgi:hypothetical protein
LQALIGTGFAMSHQQINGLINFAVYFVPIILFSLTNQRKR